MILLLLFHHTNAYFNWRLSGRSGTILLFLDHPHIEPFRSFYWTKRHHHGATWSDESDLFLFLTFCIHVSANITCRPSRLWFLAHPADSLPLYFLCLICILQLTCCGAVNLNSMYIECIVQKGIFNFCIVCSVFSTHTKSGVKSRQLYLGTSHSDQRSSSCKTAWVQGTWPQRGGELNTSTIQTSPVHNAQAEQTCS